MSSTSAADRPRLLARLFEPVDIASLAYFRVVFAAIMLYEARHALNSGMIRSYLESKFLFTYYGFGWVNPWPGEGLYWHWVVMGLAAAGVLVGFCYRLNAVVLFLGFTYVFLLEQARYLNHFYFVSLVCFLMIFVPAHRAWSFDARWFPSLRSQTAPAWALWILRFQLGVVYFFGGVAKLNSDWLQAEPMRTWLANRADTPIVGPLFNQEWVAWAFSYGGLALDLFAVPLLLWKKTRAWTFAAAVFFHVTNSMLFDIGIFPWFSIAMTALFFPPDWPRRLFGRDPSIPITEEPPAQPAPAPEPSATAAVSTAVDLRPGQKVAAALLAVYVAIQVFLPLRHWLYPGEVSWTEEGHNFSWRMKLRDKKGKAEFYVTDAVSQKRWKIDPTDYLTSRQYRKMSTRPDMILQFAHFLAAEKRKKGYEQVEVRARVMATLHGRKRQLLIDPEVDLAAQRPTLRHVPWIVPLAKDSQETSQQPKEETMEGVDVPGGD